MNISRRKKIIILIALLLAAIAAGWVLWQGLDRFSEDESLNSEQKEKISACGIFSLDDAKEIFGEDVYQNALDDKNENKISTKIDKAPEAEVTTSTCAYTKDEWKMNNSTEQPDAVDTEPASPGGQNPVDPKVMLGRIKEASAQADPTPEFLAVITIRSTAQGNASSDFNKLKTNSTQDVEELGKAAFWDPKSVGISGKKQGSLSVLIDDKTLIINGDNLSLETAKKIAQMTMSELPKE